MENIMSWVQDNVGKRFGKIYTKEIIREKWKKPKYLCVCDCGKEKLIDSGSVKRGADSCGCFTSQKITNSNRVHGMSRTKIHSIWKAMKQRCLNPKNQRYKDYGGRGISICDRWLDFQNFYEDVGDYPIGMTLDRRNNDKGYSPENCRWITYRDNNNNTRRSVYVEYKGETKTLSQWCTLLGLNNNAMKTRLNYNWDIERAFTTPVKKYKPRKNGTTTISNPSI